MKFKKIMLVSIILLAILTIGAVSAGEDASGALAVDNITDEAIASPDDGDMIADDDVDDSDSDGDVDDDVDDSDSDGDVDDDVDNSDDDWDDEYEEGNGTEIVNMNVEFPKEVAVAKEYTINITFDKEVSGHLEAGCDSCTYRTDLYDEEYTSIHFKTYDFGHQTYQIKYFGDDTYAPQIITGEFTADKYVIECDDQAGAYGGNITLYFSVPNNFSNNITLVVCGKEYQVEKDDDGDYSYSVGGLKFGNNTLGLRYHDETYGDYDGTFIITAYPEIIIPSSAALNEAEVYLLLPSDAKGTLNVYRAEFNEDDDLVNQELLGKAIMKDGRAAVMLTGLALGEHYIVGEYVNDSKYEVDSVEGSIFINPQVTVPELVLPGKDAFAEIYVGKGVSGNFILSEYVLNDEDEEDPVEYTGKVTDGYAKIMLNHLDNGYHYLVAQFMDSNGEEVYTSDYYEVKVINVTNMYIIDGVEDGITLVEYGGFEVFLPEELNGTAQVFVDEVLMGEVASDDYVNFDFPILGDGNHKIIVKYTGVDCNFTKVISFKVASSNIVIPEEFNIMDDYIYVELSKNTTGTLKVYVDGKLLKTESISNTYYVDTNDITLGTHKVKITFTNDATKATTSKEQNVKFFYNMDIYTDDPYIYGEPYNEVRIMLPSDVAGDITVTIDGKKRKWTSNGYEMLVNISDLAPGSHKLVVTHSGDEKYSKLSKEFSFEVEGRITIPEYSFDLISLTLPNNAKGNMILDIYKINGYDEEDDEPITEFLKTEKIPLSKGKATFDPSGLAFGNYLIEGRYDGSDYTVEATEGELRSGLNVDCPDETYLNNASTIVIKAPKNGIVNISIGIIASGNEDGNGVIPVSSSLLTGEEYVFTPQLLGRYQIHMDYIFDGEIVSDSDYYIDVVPNELDIPLQMEYNRTSTVSMILPSDATGYMTVGIYTYQYVPGDDGEDIEVRVLIRNVTSAVDGGIASVDLPGDLPYDGYCIEVNYTGNKGNYSTYHYSSVVPHMDVPKFISDSGGDLEFDVGDVDGDISVSVQGKNVTAEVINGKAVIVLPDSLSGGRSGDIVIRYMDSNGVERVVSKAVYVKQSVDLNVVSSGNTASNLIIKVSLSNRFETGNVTVKIKGVEKTSVIESGYATFNFGKLAYGSYKAEVTYSGNDRTDSASKNVTVQINYVPTIKASNAKVYYNEGKYSISLKGYDGKVVKNTYVTFKINGKTYKKVKTNSKGVATIKLNKKHVPKTYKVTATALGKSVTKKITVKQVLTLKKVKVKKSAKKLVLKATLKKGKKAIKGKKITFKFNGKTYKAKTNKKGVAKVTVKKAKLKKLKVGKKIKYQATYLKVTVKKTAKVKK